MTVPKQSLEVVRAAFAQAQPLVLSHARPLVLPELGPPALRGVEVVVPFTGMAGVQAALRQASRLCPGLDATVRIVRVLVVPYPLDLDHPPCSVSFAAEQMSTLQCELPLLFDIRLSRQQTPAFLDSMTDHSVVLIASNRRPWATREERLARTLKRRGCQVLLTYGDVRNA